MKKIKAYCFYNKKWKEWGWDNPLQQLPFPCEKGIGKMIFPLAIFETKKEADLFYKDGNRKDIKKVVCEINIK